MKVRPDGSQEYTAAEQLDKTMNRTTKKYIREAAAQHSEQSRRLARYDEAKALVKELSGALIALHAIVEEEGGSLLLSCPLTDKRARKAYAAACDFLATEPKGDAE